MMMTDGVFRDSEASSLARRMPWGASDAPEAARERCWCQLVGTHAAADKKLLVSQMATSNNAKKSKMPRQMLSESASVMVMVITDGDAYSSRGKSGTNSKRLKVRAALAT